MKDLELLSFDSPFSSNDVLNQIQSEIKSTLGLKSTLVLPTVASILNSNSEVRSQAKGTFDRLGTVSGKYGDVPYDIQLLQGILFSSVVFGYHKPSGRVALYTACEKVFSAINPDYNFNIGKTYELNAEGVLNAARIDINYISLQDFSPKLTRLTVKTHLVSNDYILVPLESVYTLFNIIANNLSVGRVAYVQQLVSGVVKERFITNNANVLRKYSDSKEFASSVSPISVPQLASLRAYFPVVGATSNTTGLTGINLLSVEKLGFVKDNGSLVEVSDFGGIIRLVVISLISNELARNYSEDLVSTYNRYIEGIVDIITHEVFLEAVDSIAVPKDMPEDAIVSLEAVNYLLRDMSDSQLQETWTMCLDRGMETNNPQKLVKLISGRYEKLGTDISNEDLSDLLSENILKVVTTKKDGSFSTMYVTNNENYLSDVYGYDYRTRLESIGSRIRSAKYYLAKGELMFDEVMEYLGFDDFIGKGPDKAVDNLDTFTSLVEENISYNSRKPNSNENLVLGRRLFGVVTPKGVEDYYCNIDITRIYEIVKLT